MLQFLPSFTRQGNYTRVGNLFMPLLLMCGQRVYQMYIFHFCHIDNEIVIAFLETNNVIKCATQR